MQLRDSHIVEHIEGDNTKFGLRKGKLLHQNDQNTTIVKASSEANKIYWIKTLRDLKMDMKRAIGNTSLKFLEMIEINFNCYYYLLLDEKSSISSSISRSGSTRTPSNVSSSKTEGSVGSSVLRDNVRRPSERDSIHSVGSSGSLPTVSSMAKISVCFRSYFFLLILLDFLLKTRWNIGRSNFTCYCYPSLFLCLFFVFSIFNTS
jgi:hypothetical protein